MSYTEYIKIFIEKWSDDSITIGLGTNKDILKNDLFALINIALRDGFMSGANAIGTGDKKIIQNKSIEYADSFINYISTSINNI